MKDYLLYYLLLGLETTKGGLKCMTVESKIFSLASMKLRKLSIDDNFDKEILERRSRTFDADNSDEFFYEILVRDIFGGGMKASLIRMKLPFIKKAFANFNIEQVSTYNENDLNRMLMNPNIIHNRRRLVDCIQNAKEMKKKSNEHGSFGNFLKQYVDDTNELSIRLKLLFGSVGQIIALNFLKDIGVDTIKPDVHILRVLHRLGFLNSEKPTKINIQKTMLLAEKMKLSPSEKLSVVDAVLWMYGGGGDGHVRKAICNKNNPFCDECPLTSYCRYFEKKEEQNL